MGFSSWNNTRITRVELTADSTNVTVEYTKTQKDSKQAWVSFSSSTYLRPKGGFVSYHVQAMGDKKELDKRYTTIDAIGTKYVFTLIFPKLEPGVEYFDIIEPPDGFRWENVTIKEPQNFLFRQLQPQKQKSKSKLMLYKNQGNPILKPNR